MAFKNDYKPLGIESLREQKKRLHYTIKDIGGPSELTKWKTEQAVKEAVWQAKKAERVSGVIKGMEDGSLANKEYAKSETTKAYERGFGVFRTGRNSPSEIFSQSLSEDVRISVLTRIWNWCVNKFINVNLP
jgi:hypothetical protein